jgi:hypothetical protein
MLTGNKLITPVSEGCLSYEKASLRKKNGPFGGGRRSDLAL